MRWLLLCSGMWLSAIGFPASQAAAADPAPGDLLPAGGLFRVEWTRPAQLLEHPLARRFEEILAESDESARLWERPEMDGLLQFRDQIEETTKLPWRKAVDQFTAGGMALSLTPVANGSPDVLLVSAAADAEAAQQLRRVLETLVLAQIPEEIRPAKLPVERHREVECVIAGPARFAVADQTLLLASRPELIKEAIELYLQPPRSNAAKGNRPWMRAEADVAIIRALPDIRKAIQLPAEDPPRIFLLGGWIDLLHRAERVNAEIQLNDEGFDLQLRWTTKPTEASNGLAGFFANGKEQQALPPLAVPGTIASFSWFRDYASLWDGREQTLTGPARERAEEADAQSRQQLSVIGGKFTLSELASHLGNHFRVVIARQQQTAYEKVSLNSRLPAAAIAVDVRDDQFQELLRPLLRFAGLVAAADGRRMMTQVESYGDVELTSFRWRQDAESQASNGRIRYQFSPTYGFAEKHFIIGSTTEITRQVVDALRAEANQPSPAASEPGTTELSRFSSLQASLAVADFLPALVQQTVLDRGVSLHKAESDWSTLRKLLEAFGEITAKIERDDNALTLRLHSRPTP